MNQIVSTTESAIGLSHLCRRYGKSNVVDDVSLTIAPGTTCGFIGLNGAGKTTTIACWWGCSRPRPARFIWPVAKCRASVTVPSD
jgi:ABC-type multidrug transport system ATPase subunit